GPAPGRPAADRPPRAPGRSPRRPAPWMRPAPETPPGWARAQPLPRIARKERREGPGGPSSFLEAHQDRSVGQRLGIVAPEQAFVQEGQGPVGARRAARPGPLVPDPDARARRLDLRQRAASLLDRVLPLDHVRE